jgi:cytosine/adenosine deaminase-related metal-dependent hydrolase
MPGFVNVHTHVSMAPFRGLGEDLPDRLRRFLFPLEKRFVTPELVYDGARFG